MSLARRAIVAGALLSIVSGCSGEGAVPQAASSPQPGGSVTFAVSSAFGGFDPNVTVSVQDARVLRQVYDSLVDLQPDGTLVPWLASRWTISEDGLTYTFSLRDGVRFHDGSTFDAAAVCANFDRIKNPETKSLYAISLIGPYESCAADGLTATVRLSTPYTPFLANLSTPFLGVVSPEAAKKPDFATAPVGTGPFRFVSYRPNSDVALTRFADYAWPPENAGHQGAAYLENLRFQIIPDATVRLGSLRNGDVQSAGDVPAQQVATVQRDSTLTYTDQQQSGATYQLFFNTERPGLDDPAVRRALTRAMDVDAAVKATYFGAYARSQAPLSPVSVGYAASVTSGLGYDVATAKTELDAAGWLPGPDGVRVKDGKRLVLDYLVPAPNYDSRQEIAEFLKQNLTAAGAEVNLKQLPAAEAFAAVTAGDYGIATTSFVAVDPDIMNTIYGSASTFNLSRTKDFDDQLVRAQRLPSGPDRDGLYAEIQTATVAQAYSVPVYVSSYRVASSAALRGVGYDVAAYPKFYDAYLTR